HGGRTVGPDPHGVGRLPFALANIQMIVARGTAPIDAVRRFAGDEASILPKILARSGPAPAVKPVDHGRGDATRLQDPERHGGGERARSRRGAARRVAVEGTGRYRAGPSLIRSGPAEGQPPPR